MFLWHDFVSLLFGIIGKLAWRRKVFTEAVTKYERTKMENTKAPTDRSQAKGLDPQKMQEFICEKAEQARIKIGVSGSPMFRGNQVCGFSHSFVTPGFSRHLMSGAIPISAITAHSSSFSNPIGTSSSEFLMFSGKTEEEIKKEVINALENKDYDWRSLNGVAKSTNLPKEDIKEAIKQLIKEGTVIYAPYKNKKGHKLYTTVNHYRKTRGLLVRIASTLTDRVI